MLFYRIQIITVHFDDNLQSLLLKKNAVINPLCALR